MGLFDYVNYTAPCPTCKQELTPHDWQSKDYFCSLSTVEPWKVKRFYAICPKCKTWVEAAVEAEVETIVHKCEVTITTRSA